MALLWVASSHLDAASPCQTRASAIERVHVAISQDVAISPAELETIRDQLTSIWEREDVVIDLTDAPHADGVQLVLTGAPIRVTPPTGNLCDLGVIRFVEGVPQRQFRVSVTAAREFVRQARPEWPSAIRTLVAARIMGRVAAHELGHYLLGESGHRARGLMRARFDGADLLGPHLGAFAPPHRAEVEAGLTRAATAAATEPAR
jgi:hypothetical protein